VEIISGRRCGKAIAEPNDIANLPPSLRRHYPASPLPRGSPCLAQFYLEEE
jgi:hypothetical protein